MLKAIKVRLYPSEEQIIYMSKLFGCSRVVYNKGLEYKIGEKEKTGKTPSSTKVSNYITTIKHTEEYIWLNEVHSKVLQQSLIDLDKAYNNFFENNKGYPKYKSKNNKQSCRFPVDAFRYIKGNRLSIIMPLSNIHYKCSKRDEIYLNKNQDFIKSSTLSKTKSDKYFLSILIDREPTKTLPTTENKIGIDLGIKDFVITSNGKTYNNIKIKRNNINKLKRLHQNLSRKEKGSKNKNKASVKLARYYEKLTNIKENYLHHISNQLLNDNQVIAIETLNVSGMLKNHKLAKAIQELSLYRFKEILKYKADWYNREIVSIDQFYPSSKLCSKCGYKNDNIDLKIRSWICPHCGANHDRDINAATNILNEGNRIINRVRFARINAFGDDTLVSSLN